MKNILLTIFFLISGSSMAQHQILDSLKREIQKRVAVDTMTLILRTEFVMHSFLHNPSDSTLLNFSNETVGLAKSIKYPKGEALALHHIGIIYQFVQAKPLEALAMYQEAIKIFDQHEKLKPYLPATLTNIGTIYMEQQDYRQALKTYRRIRNEFGSKSFPELYLGNAFGELGEYDSSVNYFKETIRLANLNRNVPYKTNAMSNLGLMQIELDSLRGSDLINYRGQALLNTDSAVLLTNLYGIEILRPTIYINAAEVYLLTDNYEKAVFYCEEALKLSALQNNLAVKKSLYATLYDVHKKLKNYEKALEAHMQFKLYSDSLTSIDQRLEFQRKDLEFEAERNELQAQSEIDRQKLRNRQLIWSSIGIILVLVFLIVYFQIRRSTRARIREEEFNRNLAETRLIALRAQLNPHFVGNVLSAIDNYMIEHGPEKASNYLLRFSKLMRTILENSDKDWVPLNAELNLMEEFVKIESIRFKEPIEWQVIIDEEIDTQNVMVPTMFIQPIIENSIEHGLLKKGSKGTIKVTINHRSDHFLQCTVEDDGVGPSEEEIKSTSKGMAIVRERIRYLNQSLKAELSFASKKLNPGFQVTMNVPITHKF